MLPAFLNQSDSLKRWVLVLYWVGMFTATHKTGLDTVGPHEWWKFPHADKVAHFSLYAGWALLWGWVLLSRPRGLTRGLIVALLLAAAVYAAMDETTQAWVDRQPDVLDFLADMVGVVVGMVASLWLHRRWRARTSR